VALERFRTNGEKYSASKITESLLKINVSKFCKRMNENYDIEKMIKEKKNKHIRGDNKAPLKSLKSSNNNDYLSSSDSLNSSTSNINSEAKKEDINKDITTESSSSLSNIFTSYSIKYMRILMFITFLLIIVCVSLEFIMVYQHMNKLRMKLHFYYSGHIILSDLVYTKLFVTEGVIANTLNKSNIIYEL
jgi:ATP-dependent Zn protease